MRNLTPVFLKCVVVFVIHFRMSGARVRNRCRHGGDHSVVGQARTRVSPVVQFGMSLQSGAAQLTRGGGVFIGGAGRRMF